MSSVVPVLVCKKRNKNSAAEFYVLHMEKVTAGTVLERHRRAELALIYVCWWLLIFFLKFCSSRILRMSFFMVVLKTDISNSRVSPQILMPLKHLWSFLLFSKGQHPFLFFLEVLKQNHPLSSAYSIFYCYFFHKFLSGHPGIVKEIFSCEEHEIKTSQLWLSINCITALGICTVVDNFLMAALAFWLQN